MPRIDPEQLLKCLSVLLASNGGIKSLEEVQRLVTLMLRFSKKLVSKCIYINILNNTDTDVLGSFMTVGGWTMTLTWMCEGIESENWPLVEEILKLLFLCPIDVERLKSNTLPRKVKALSKEASVPGVRYLATCLVERWLKVVKGEMVPPLNSFEIPVCPSNFEQNLISIEHNLHDICSGENTNHIIKLRNKNNSIDESATTDNEIVEVNCKSDNVNNDGDYNDKRDSVIKELVSTSNKTNDNSETTKKKSEHKASSKKSLHSDKSHDEKSRRSEHRSSSSSRSSSHSSHKSKDHSKKDRNKKDKDTSRKDSSRDKSKEKEKSKEKSSDKEKEKDKHKLNESKSRNEESKSKEKHLSDKSSGKLRTIPISELGKIPKKKSISDEHSEVKKTKHSISIEVRKNTESNRPKTVKMFHSKFRSHGLEEEAKPPPPRGQAKKTPAPVPTPIPKRSSPMRLLDTPPEKKPKITEILEKPGAIKLIPPKPKPAFLQESVMFMDALTASATNKKEPKKKKRKLSISKDSSQEGSPPTSPVTPTSQQSSPAVDLPKSAPFRFYQDTLDSEEIKDGKMESKGDVIVKNYNTKEEEEKIDDISMKSPLVSPPRKLIEEKVEKPTELEKVEMDIESNIEKDGLKSILTINKNKGPKKSLRWRDANLEEIQYFELDENERVNVTRTFLDMKQMERVHERESFQKARNLINDDLMGEQTTWRALIPIDAPVIEYGKKSREKDIQLARQKTVLQCLYLNKQMVPDTAAEPDHEQFEVVNTIMIPLEDISGGADNVEDLSDRPWPEPKLHAPQPMQVNNAATNMYNPMPPFGPGFQGPPMSGPMFPPGPVAMSGEWPMNGPNMMMQNGMNCPPEMFMGPGSGSMFPPSMNGDFPMMDNMNNMNGPMFSQGFPGPMVNMLPNGPIMNRPIGPNGPNGPPFAGFPNNRGNNNRGSNINRGGGGSWRGKGNWNGPSRGGSNVTRGTLKRCIHFQKKGYCRQENNCHFAHY